MANGLCPKCGAVKENPIRSYCRVCENAYQNERNRINPPPPRTPEQAKRKGEMERERFANMSRDELVEYYKRKREWRNANPFTEEERIDQRKRAAKARSKWTPERREQQKATQRAHYERMLIRASLGLCAYSVTCNEEPIGNQKFCLRHWIRGIRQAEIRLRPEYSAVELLEKWISQNGRCAITGVPLIAGETACLDHILPVSRGGTSGIDNIRFIHSMLNRMKWNLTDSEFKAFNLELCAPLIEWSKNGS